MRSMSQCFNIVYLAVAFTAGQLTVAGRDRPTVKMALLAH